MHKGTSIIIYRKSKKNCGLINAGGKSIAYERFLHFAGYDYILFKAAVYFSAAVFYYSSNIHMILCQ